jgi:hypothetical protein
VSFSYDGRGPPILAARQYRQLPNPPTSSVVGNNNSVSTSLPKQLCHKYIDYCTHKHQVETTSSHLVCGVNNVAATEDQHISASGVPPADKNYLGCKALSALNLPRGLLEQTLITEHGISDLIDFWRDGEGLIV